MKKIILTTFLITLTINSLQASNDEKDVFVKYESAAAPADLTAHLLKVNSLLDKQVGTLEQVTVINNREAYFSVGEPAPRINAPASWIDGTAIATALNNMVPDSAVSTDYEISLVKISNNSINDKYLESMLKISFLRYFFGFNPVSGVNADVPFRSPILARLSLTMSDGLSSSRYSLINVVDPATIVVNIKEDFQNFNIYHLAHMAAVTCIGDFAT